MSFPCDYELTEYLLYECLFCWLLPSREYFSYRDPRMPPPLHPQVTRPGITASMQDLGFWAVELTHLLGLERRQGGLIGNSGLKTNQTKNILIRSQGLKCTAGFYEGLTYSVAFCKVSQNVLPSEAFRRRGCNG